MFHTIDEFEKSWGQESANTQKQIDRLTDASLGQAIVDGHRTLGRIAWHIVTTIPEMMSKTGLKLSSIDFKAPVPASADVIKKVYARASKELMDAVKSNWDDAGLMVEDEMYGEKWKRGVTLQILINHEVHHRGQMTVLMRQAGLIVPGFYGPAKEEWSRFGGQPPKV
jgi:uncharacterized damage-inducible protein DinB